MTDSRPAAGAEADAAWEAMRVELLSGAPEPTWSGGVLARHRPRIEAAIRATPTPDATDAARVPINIKPEVRDALNHYLYNEPAMRGVGFSEFITRAIAASNAALHPDATDAGSRPALRDWQRDLLTFDADGLSLEVVVDLLGVKSVNLRVEQDDEGNPLSEDRRWRVQYFGGTYGGTLRAALAAPSTPTTEGRNDR